MSERWKIKVKMLIWIYVFRLLNALASSSFFQPDEYFQSLEIAHSIAFDYGYRTWEWQSDNALRSPFHAWIFVPGYYLLKVTGVDSAMLIILMPKLVQALIAAFIDFYTYKLAQRLYGPAIARTALTCSLLSLFNAYVSIRTFSNIFEAALTAATLYLWPWHRSDITYTNLYRSLSLAALTCIVRPPNVFVWAVPGLRLLHLASKQRRRGVVRAALVCGCSAILLSFLVDSVHYGRPTLTLWNFFRFNVWHGHASFYGAMPWHYYLSQGLPMLCFNQLPAVVQTVVRRGRSAQKDSSRDTLVFTCLITLLAYSLLKHKEVRFAYLLSPILHILAAQSLYTPKTGWTGLSNRTFWIMLSTSLLPALYLLQVHGSGLIQVMAHLRTSDAQSVGFLMPCHSTPWQSHLHLRQLSQLQDTNGQSSRLWALTCEPPINAPIPSEYVSEQDLFYAHPIAFIQSSIIDPAPKQVSRPLVWPTHLVIFDSLLKVTEDNTSVAQALASKGYVDSQRIPNGHWQDDSRRAGDIVILKRTKFV